MSQLLTAKQPAEEIYRKVLLDLSLLSFVPKLAVVLVGADAASQTYVRAKRKKCQDLGMRGDTIELAATVTESELLDVVRTLNEDLEVTGILVQLPLPAHISARKILGAIHPLKDVDGLHPENIGLLSVGEPRLVPCTPSGVVELLKFYKIEVATKHAVVIGRSDIVGRPMARLLEHMNATVTVCHSKTQNLVEYTRRADILVAALGKPKAIGAQHVRSGAVVVDVGIHRQDGGLCGDVDFEAVAPVCHAITPVPGGVGPMTIAMLMKNVLAGGLLQKE